MEAFPSVVLPVDRYLAQLHADFAGLRDGQVADYVPPLAQADPERFGICIATVDGQVYQAGDTDVEFTIQSISKPFTYGLALQDRGLAEVQRRIGVEPSGDAFNEISLDERGRPFNPMINAGAIMAASLVAGNDPAARIIDAYGTWAGRPLALDVGVYEAERETGHRNRAIAHMLRAVGTLDGEPERALDTYFRQCSVAVTGRDLAVMAAALAGRGVNPLTRERALPDDLVDHVLSVMTTCGMYDAAGEWLVDVGIPAKSGVGGGIIGVLPGQLGVAVFSPRLDAVGNSLRGVAVYRQLAQDLRLHFLNVGRSARSTAARSYRVSDVPSTRRRSVHQRVVLEAAADDGLVMELAGDVLFSGAEAACRTALATRRRFVIVDLSRAGIVDGAATRVLAGLGEELARFGGDLLIAAGGRSVLDAVSVRSFDTVDEAKEWCEDEVLQRAGASMGIPTLTLAQHPLCANLSPEQVEHLAGMAVERRFAAGEMLVRAGDAADAVLLLTAGEVEVSTTTASGRRRRLSTLTAGAVVGESAVTGTARRTADVVALTDGAATVLSAADLAAAPAQLRATVLRDLLGTAHEALARSTREIAALVR